MKENVLVLLLVLAASALTSGSAQQQSFLGTISDSCKVDVKDLLNFLKSEKVGGKQLSGSCGGDGEPACVPRVCGDWESKTNYAGQLVKEISNSPDTHWCQKACLHDPRCAVANFILRDGASKRICQLLHGTSSTPLPTDRVPGLKESFSFAVCSRFRGCNPGSEFAPMLNRCMSCEGSPNCVAPAPSCGGPGEKPCTFTKCGHWHKEVHYTDVDVIPALQHKAKKARDHAWCIKACQRDSRCNVAAWAHLHSPLPDGRKTKCTLGFIRTDSAVPVAHHPDRNVRDESTYVLCERFRGCQKGNTLLGLTCEALPAIAPPCGKETEPACIKSNYQLCDENLRVLKGICVTGGCGGNGQRPCKKPKVCQKWEHDVVYQNAEFLEVAKDARDHHWCSKACTKNASCSLATWALVNVNGHWRWQCKLFVADQSPPIPLAFTGLKEIYRHHHSYAICDRIQACNRGLTVFNGFCAPCGLPGAPACTQVVQCGGDGERPCFSKECNKWVGHLDVTGALPLPDNARPANTRDHAWCSKACLMDPRCNYASWQQVHGRHPECILNFAPVMLPAPSAHVEYQSFRSKSAYIVCDRVQQCNPGTVLKGTVCKTSCGKVDQPTCPPPKPECESGLEPLNGICVPECGGEDEICCGGETCDLDTLGCSEGVCVPCGKEDKPGCTNPKVPECEDGLHLVDGICETPCGDNDDVCCEGDRCDSDHLGCVDGFCKPCGKHGLPACTEPEVPSCEDGLIAAHGLCKCKHGLTLKDGKCVKEEAPCGKLWDDCCPDKTCADADLICWWGKCVKCGETNKRACPGNKCNEGLVVRHGICRNW